MRKRKSVIIICVIILLFVALFVFAYLGLRTEETIERRKITDIEWYSENETDFTITTAQELYDLVELSYYYDFVGQTIKLGADIVVNEGNANEWSDKSPTNIWYAIEKFGGTLDGQGYSISGLYSKNYDTEVGLVGEALTGCTIKNLRLLNSYFEVYTGNGTAAFASFGSGHFKQLYTDAIIVNKGVAFGYTGGIVGKVNDNTVIEECWFDGSLYTTARTAGGIAATVQGGTLKISHCLNTGYLHSEYIKGSARIAGICGITANSMSMLEMSDCFNAGVIDSTNKVQVASVLGLVENNTTAVLQNCYATKESYGMTIHSVFEQGVLEGGAIQYAEEMILGYGAYEWMELDFDKYWTVVEDGTPILQCFAESIPSLVGYTKKYDLSWYDKNATEYIIQTKEQFIGFSMISQTTNFKNKTVKLDADITVNEGKASNWAKKEPTLQWNTIGSVTIPFVGTFDGQGHTISGVYCNAAQYVGLFGKTLAGCTIKNFKLKNSCFIANTKEGEGSFIGSISGRGGGKFDSIYSSAIVLSNGIACGGLIGQINEAQASHITNCWFDGTLKMTTEYGHQGGGIVGQIAVGSATIEHCLFSGSIFAEIEKRASSRIGGICGCVMNEGVSLTMKDSLSVGKISVINTTHVGSVVGVAYKDTEMTVENTYGSLSTYGKTVGAALGNSHGGAIQLDESFLIGYAGYEWTDLDFKDYWAVALKGTPVLKKFTTSSPSLAGKSKMFSTKWYKADAKSYNISTRQDLYGLVMLAQTTDFANKIIYLKKDITVNDGEANEWAKKAPRLLWTPIGNETYPFAGTFDGQGHTISGVYASGVNTIGLFGKATSTALIKNLRLVNSYMKATTADDKGAFIGSICGRGGGTFDTIYSNAIVEATSFACGGIFGQVNIKEKSVFNNCWFDGVVNMTTEYGHVGGGIVAQVVAGETEISHCLNTGSISAEVNKRASSRLGGLIGAIQNKDTKVTIQDSLATGKITAVNKTHVGAAIGVAYKEVNLIVENSHCSTAAYSKPVGDIAANVRGGIVTVHEKNLLGYNGFQWTDLDFDGYWAVQLTGIPILKSFASSIPSLAGVEKLFDKTWYSDSKSEYVLNNKNQLYGFAMLSQTNNFSGKTVKLGANITVNSKGDISLSWLPIGNATYPFAGTFDGQGHIISGVYAVSENTVGLFANTAVSAHIKNFSLKDSYFKATNEDNRGAFVASISGRGGGQFDTIYSDAIVEGSSFACGGLFGQLNVKGMSSFNNCWFDGEVRMTTEYGHIGGGIVAQIAVGETKISHCLNTGEISAEINKRASSRIGGLVGAIQNKGTIVTIQDSLAAGKITAVNKTHVGAAVGVAYMDMKLVVENSYCSNATYNKPIGAMTNNVKGEIVAIAATNLLDVGAYQWTELDFYVATKNPQGHWVAKKSDVPCLKSFVDLGIVVQDEVKSIENVPKPDINWFNNTDKEFTISTAEQLLGLSALVSQGKTFEGITINLGADIYMNGTTSSTIDVSDWANHAPDFTWMSIGSDGKPFAGTFDGHMYSINGLYLNITSTSGNEPAGMFGLTNKKAIIRNLIIDHSYISSTNNFLGVVAGRGGGTFDTIYVKRDVTLRGSAGGYGGIIGQSNVGSDIENCWFDGKMCMTGNGQNAGGLVGTIVAAPVKIKFCLSSGIFTTERTTEANLGGLIGIVMSYSGWVRDSLSVATIPSNSENCAMVIGYVNGNTGANIINSYALTGGNGALCKASNAVYPYPASGENVGTTVVVLDDINKLYGENAHNNTYLDFVGHWVAINNSTPELKSFTTQKTEDQVTLTSIRPNTALYSAYNNQTKFVICSASDLYGYIAVNKNFYNKKIVLEEDIVVNTGDAAQWNSTTAGLYPWSKSATLFNGTFDGQGYTISGLYEVQFQKVGLFGDTGDASTVRNVKLSNCYFENTAAGMAHAGTISGNGSGLFENIYVDNTVYLKSNGHDNGGIIGKARNNTTTIRNCYSAANISATNSSQGYNNGGMVGMSESTTLTIQNSYFAGSITTPDTTGYNNGGLLGELNRNTATLTACLVTGTITNGSSNANVGANTGGICGAVSNTATKLSVNKCLVAGKINSEFTINVGAIIGTKKVTPQLIITNTYGTTETWSQMQGGIFGSYSGDWDAMKIMDIEFLHGDNAKNYASQLGYDEDWTTREEQVPIPTTLIELQKIIH